MIKFISTHHLSHKTILLRVDFNVSLKQNHSIADDTRIQLALPTIKLLLKQQNKLIIVSHLGEPKQRDMVFSLKRVAKDLAHYLPSYSIHLVSDFIKDDSVIRGQKQHEIVLLENIRFFPGEIQNDPIFARQLANLAEIYVNDAFGVSHRKHASVYGITQYLPSYAGLLMEKEITSLNKLLHNPARPFVAIIGGSKISTKIKLLRKLLSLADSLLIGGAMANTFLLAQQYKVGESLVEKDEVSIAQDLIKQARQVGKSLILPVDAIVQDHPDHETSVKQVKQHDCIMDIGSETQAMFGKQISLAKTVVWNGPVGKFEETNFARGTEFVYYAISLNTSAYTVIGGGDTLAAVTKKEYLENISHISSGGGAMLEYIENGTLPGIEALT